MRAAEAAQAAGRAAQNAAANAQAAVPVAIFKAKQNREADKAAMLAKVLATVEDEKVEKAGPDNAQVRIRVNTPSKARNAAGRVDAHSHPVITEKVTAAVAPAPAVEWKESQQT